MSPVLQENKVDVFKLQLSLPYNAIYILGFSPRHFTMYTSHPRPISRPPCSLSPLLCRTPPPATTTNPHPTSRIPHPSSRAKVKVKDHPGKKPPPTTPTSPLHEPLLNLYT